MGNLTTVQKLAIVLAILGAVAGGGSQLTDILGPALTKTIVALAGLLSTVISSTMVVITGQANAVKFVQSMPGVQQITVNSQANQTLASLAVDPNQTKVVATPEAAGAVANIAKGT